MFEFKDWLQYGVVIPVAYVWYLVNQIRSEVITVRSNTYTKDETKEMIDLKHEPMTQRLEAMQDDLRYIRKTLENRNE